LAPFAVITDILFLLNGYLLLNSATSSWLKPKARSSPLTTVAGTLITSSLRNSSAHSWLTEILRSSTSTPDCLRALTIVKQAPQPLSLYTITSCCLRSEEHTSELQSRFDLV